MILTLLNGTWQRDGFRIKWNGLVTTTFTSHGAEIFFLCHVLSCLQKLSYQGGTPVSDQRRCDLSGPQHWPLPTFCVLREKRRSDRNVTFERRRNYRHDSCSSPHRLRLTKIHICSCLSFLSIVTTLTHPNVCAPVFQSMDLPAASR